MKEFFRGFTLTGWLAIVLLVVLVASLSYCAYDADRDRRAAEALALGNSEVQQTDTGAREKSADERLADALSTADMKQELADAVATLPDDMPSDRRLALACRRLRLQDRGAPVTPACVRFEGGAQAGADR